MGILPSFTSSFYSFIERELGLLFLFRMDCYLVGLLFLYGIWRVRITLWYFFLERIILNSSSLMYFYDFLASFISWLCFRAQLLTRMLSFLLLRESSRSELIIINKINKQTNAKIILSDAACSWYVTSPRNWSTLLHPYVPYLVAV